MTRILAQPGERVKKGAPLAVIESPDVGNAFSDLGKAAGRSRPPPSTISRARRSLRSARRIAEGLRGGAGQLRQGQGRDGSRARRRRRCSARAPPTRSRRSTRCARRSTARSSRATSTPAPRCRASTRAAPPSSCSPSASSTASGCWPTCSRWISGACSKGAPVTLKVVAYPDRVFSGKVDYISDSLDPIARTARVRCSVANPDARAQARDVRDGEHRRRRAARSPALAAHRGAAHRRPDRRLRRDRHRARRPPQVRAPRGRRRRDEGGDVRPGPARRRAWASAWSARARILLSGML